MALTPNVAVVVPGELITAAHLNNIRANLDRLDTTKFATTGGLVAGGVLVGGSPSSGAGISIGIDGRTTQSVTDQALAGSANLNLARGGAGTVSGPGAAFIRFWRSASPTNPLDVIVGSVTVAAGASSVVYNTTSDARLKTVVGDVVDAVDVVEALRPVRFVWNGDDTETEQTGFLAQDVADVIPGAVSGDPDGDVDTAPMQFNPSALIPFLVGAVQELAARVAELEAVR